MDWVNDIFVTAANFYDLYCLLGGQADYARLTSRCSVPCVQYGANNGRSITASGFCPSLGPSVSAIAKYSLAFVQIPPRCKCHWSVAAWELYATCCPS